MALTVPEAVEAFRDGVFNEIYHSTASEELQDALIEAVKEVEKTVIETYKASKR